MMSIPGNKHFRIVRIYNPRCVIRKLVALSIMNQRNPYVANKMYFVTRLLLKACSCAQR